MSTPIQLNAPQLEVHIDRDKAATVRVEVETFGRTLKTLLSGRQVTSFSAKASNTT